MIHRSKMLNGRFLPGVLSVDMTNLYSVRTLSVGLPRRFTTKNRSTEHPRIHFVISILSQRL